MIDVSDDSGGGEHDAYDVGVSERLSVLTKETRSDGASFASVDWIVTCSDRATVTREPPCVQSLYLEVEVEAQSAKYTKAGWNADGNGQQHLMSHPLYERVHVVSC